VDYVALPGSVTVAAGERSAQITVIPIDDGTPDITSTVIFQAQAEYKLRDWFFRRKQRLLSSTVIGRVRVAASCLISHSI